MYVGVRIVPAWPGAHVYIHICVHGNGNKKKISKEAGPVGPQQPQQKESVKSTPKRFELLREIPIDFLREIPIDF